MLKMNPKETAKNRVAQFKQGAPAFSPTNSSIFASLQRILGQVLDVLRIIANKKPEINVSVPQQPPPHIVVKVPEHPQQEIIINIPEIKIPDIIIPEFKMPAIKMPTFKQAQQQAASDMEFIINRADNGVITSITARRK